MKEEENYENLGCNFPQCKTMVTNDENCDAHAAHDVREYYTAKRPAAGYLPLGPRRDAWNSLQEIRGKDGFVLKASSERRYAFNAIFSQSTNEGREKLAEVIASQGDDDLAYFTLVSIAKKWASP